MTKELPVPAFADHPAPGEYSSHDVLANAIPTNRTLGAAARGCRQVHPSRKPPARRRRRAAFDSKRWANLVKASLRPRRLRAEKRQPSVVAALQQHVGRFVEFGLGGN